MATRQTEVHTFIVRIRRPLSGAAAGDPEWQGEVVHVPTRRSVPFRGIEKIDAIMIDLITPDH